MATPFQVTIDCAQPHSLVEFWAAALGYEVEHDVDGVIPRLLAEGVATEDDVVEVGGRLAWKTGAACRDPEGRGPRILLELVPEAKEVKNRVHLDLFVGEERRPAEVARLEALGAKKLYDGRQGPHTWVTMADPEGNEFCVA